MKLANFPLFFGRLLAGVLLLVAGNAIGAETMVNITGTGVVLSNVQIDCNSAETTTGLALAAGATGASIYNVEVKNCTTRGVSIAEDISVFSNNWVHDNDDDLDIAAGKTLTVTGKNVFDDAAAAKGDGTYTDAGALTVWSNATGALATRTGGNPILTYAEWIAAGGDIRGKNPTNAGYSVGPTQYQKKFEADVDDMITKKSKSTAAGSYVQP